MSPDDIRARDVRLHSLIITATHNPLLSAIVASLSTALSASRVLTGMEPEWEVLGMIDLKEVAEAIVRHDPAAAQLAMVRHLENGRQPGSSRGPGRTGSRRGCPPAGAGGGVRTTSAVLEPVGTHRRPCCATSSPG